MIASTTNVRPSQGPDSPLTCLFQCVLDWIRTRSPRRSSPRARLPRRQLGLDRLDDRIVPATVSLSNGVIKYVAGSGVANQLTVDYNPVTQSYTFSDSAETITLLGVLGSGSGTNSVTLQPVGHVGVRVQLGDQDDTAHVLRTRLNKPMIVYGEAGNDQVFVGDAVTTLSNIRGDVLVRGFDGQDELHVNDYGQVLPGQLYKVTSTFVTRGGIGKIHYDAQVELVRLNTSTGNDLVQVPSTSATATTVVSLKSGGGNDTAVVGTGGTLDGIKGVVQVAGKKYPDGTLTDELIVSDYLDQNANVYRLTGNFGTNGTTYSQVWRNGTMLLNASNLKGQVLHAGAASDTIRAEVVLVPTTVNSGPGNDRVLMYPGGMYSSMKANGQAGIDTLDYTQYSNGVYVNLATGEAKDVQGGVTGVEIVLGGAGHDVLVGDGTRNLLRGNAGNDVLIGRQGPDVLDGGVGNDLLVGGRTTHDLSQVALQDIGSKWSSAASYFSGIQSLKPMYLQAGATVFADGAADTLIGGLGADWFWKDPFDVLDKAAWEQAN